MYTGADLLTDLRIRVRQGSSGAYLSTQRANSIVNQSVTKLLEQNYRTLINQGSIDEINPLIKTYASFYPYNKKVLLKPLVILSIANPSANNYVMTFATPHNIDFATYPTVQVSFNGLQGGTYNLFNGNSYDATVLSATTIQVSELGITGTYTDYSGQCVATSFVGATGEANYWPSDYYHLLAVNSVCRKVLNYTIVGVKNLTYFDITLGPNNLRTGELIRFTNFGGIAGLSGDKYVKKMGDRKVRLYNDKLLTIPFTTTGTWTSGGTIERYYGRAPFERYAEPLVSDQKADMTKISPYFPLYSVSENELVCYTSESNYDTDITQLQYIMDYITVQAEIDVTNSVTDLNQKYNQEFCRKIVETAAQLWFAINTAGEDVQISEIIQ